MTKTAENHTLWGRTYLYSPYKGVSPPPPSPGEGLFYSLHSGAIDLSSSVGGRSRFGRAGSKHELRKFYIAQEFFGGEVVEWAQNL